MNAMERFVKPGVRSLQPYSSARDEYSGRDGLFLDANENSYCEDFNRYPDPYQWDLKKEIAKWRDVSVESIFIGNGSDEVIDILIRSCCSIGRDRILCFDPSYGMYKVSSDVNEIEVDRFSLREDFTLDVDAFIRNIMPNHKLIFLCSPNNPDGSILEEESVVRILNTAPGLVIIDEAYIDFSSSETWINRLDEFNNLVVMQTFSKALGSAGIRVGMAFMHSELVLLLNKVKPPYNVSSLNQLKAISRLTDDIDKVNKCVAEIIVQRAHLAVTLASMEMIEKVYPSQANFLLVKFSDSDYVFEALKERKIIVRNRSGQRNCEGCLRITIGTSVENEQLIKALEEINNQSK